MSPLAYLAVGFCLLETVLPLSCPMMLPAERFVEASSKVFEEHSGMSLMFEKRSSWLLLAIYRLLVLFSVSLGACVDFGLLLRSLLLRSYSCD